MRIAAVLLSLSVLVACSHPALSIHVTGFEYQRPGLAPSAVLLRVENSTQSKLPLTLEPPSCPVTVAAEAALIVACALPPGDDTTLLAQPLQLVARDSGNHEVGSSCAFMLVPRDGGFMNPGLQQWEKSDPNAPVGWLNAGGTRLGFMRREVIDGVQAMHFKVPDSPKWSNGGWNSMWLRQLVPAVPMRFAIRIYPEQALERTGFPGRFFGLDLMDDEGRHAYFGIDPGLSAPAAYRRPGSTVYAFPGRLRAWNTIVVDTSVLAKNDHFVLGSRKRLDFKLVSAKVATSKIEMSGAFAGMSIAAQAAQYPCLSAKTSD